MLIILGSTITAEEPDFSAGRPVQLSKTVLPITILPAVRAADFIAGQSISRIDLMKINIEGGEYDLLEHLIDSGVIGAIADVQVQFHDFVPHAEKRMEEIQRRLSETHELTWQYKFIWENWKLKT